MSTTVLSRRRARASRFAVEACARKQRYATWDDARRAGLAVYRENPRQGYENPPLPYICEVGGERHYHCGHRPSERLHDR